MTKTISDAFRKHREAFLAGAMGFGVTGTAMLFFGRLFG